MVCARVRAIMHSLTLVLYRYVHVHNHGISKTYFIVKTIVGTKNLDPSAFIIVFQLFHIHKICDLVKVKLGIKEQLTNFYFFSRNHGHLQTENVNDPLELGQVLNFLQRQCTGVNLIEEG